MISFVFFGTPQFSTDILEHLKRHGLVPALVVTNPDRPQGRNMRLTPPPVKVWAIANNIPVLQPEILSQDSRPNAAGEQARFKIQEYRPELFVVVAYGSILPKEVLDIPKRGSLNIHYSLLPKYRGASPIESAILNDDKDTGVSVLLLDEEMDHGPIVANAKLKMENGKLEWPPKASELRALANEVGAELLTETIPLWVAGKISAKEQEHTKATYTRKFNKVDGEINLAAGPYQNFLKIQALECSIGTYFFVEKDSKKIRVNIKAAEYRNGKLIIRRVVPEGRKEMGYEEFLRGIRGRS